ncbi:MAG TPA: SDR family oxidoreductase [Bryobacteraceae bacterium]|nr:SDR family oxidoreductase [Bryobacteraceae bacterium]
MILLIGATGTTGNETARLIAGRGIDIRALVRNPDKAAALRGYGIEAVEGDAADPAALDRALRGIETLFIATSAEPRLPDLHRGIVERAKHAGVRRIVKISAAGARPDARFRFAAVHGKSDESIRGSGIAWTILRPGFFMQNLLAWASVIAQQHALVQPTGTGRTAYIDARDIAAVAAQVLLNPGHDAKTYDLTGPEALSGEEVAGVFSRVLGERITFVSPEPAKFRATLSQFGIPDWLAEGLLEGYEAISKGQAARVTGAIRELTGREPGSLEQFVRDHRAAFKQ